MYVLREVKEMFESLTSGQRTKEVNALVPEKILNILWNNEI